MDLFAMTRAHAAWRGRLFASFSCGDPIDAAEASDAGRCALGRWLADEGRVQCGHDPHHAVLMERHRAFHEAIAGVLALGEGRRAEAVDALFAPAWEEASRALVAAMIDLHETCSRSDHA